MFSERLKKSRKEKGMTQSELAAEVGVERSSIGKYETAAIFPSADVLCRIAEALGVTTDYLLGLIDDPIDRDKYERWESDDLSKYGLMPIEIKRIPLLGEIACGEPIYASEDRESYVIAGTDIKADFALKAKGDSMIGARIMDGDIVFIRKQSMVDNGEIAAVIIGDEATLKRVYFYRDDMRLVLQAENAKYPPFVYQGSELDQVRILGKAIAFQSDVK